MKRRKGTTPRAVGTRERALEEPESKHTKRGLLQYLVRMKDVRRVTPHIEERLSLEETRRMLRDVTTGSPCSKRDAHIQMVARSMLKKLPAERHEKAREYFWHWAQTYDSQHPCKR